MSIVLYMFTCSNGHTFEAPDSSGDYGEFIVRGANSPEPGVLRAVADPTYLEVDGLLHKIGAYNGKTENEQAEILQTVFGVACDPAPDGTNVYLGRRAPCPVCGATRMASWEPSRPYSGPVFEVTHDAWRQRTPSQKEVLLRQAVASIGQ